MADKVSEVTAVAGRDVGKVGVATSASNATPPLPPASAGLSVLGTTESADEFGVPFVDSLPCINPNIKVEKPKDAYNSLSLRSRDFISAKARIVPDALRHAMANIASLLVTD